MRLIRSNQDRDNWGTWASIHAAKTVEDRGLRTGKLFARYQVPACGVRLGSAWGASDWEGSADEITCLRCQAAIAKAEGGAV